MGLTNDLQMFGSGLAFGVAIVVMVYILCVELNKCNKK